MTNYVISLGGSLIVPENLDVDFLKSFKKFVLKRIEKGDKFILISGGGKTCRNYQNSAAEISEIDNEEKDWLGIHSSRLNGHLLRTIFKKEANPILITNYEEDLKLINFEKPVIVGAGWKPGFSTDYDAVLCAKHFNCKQIINLSNIDYVYSEDPKVNPNAKKFENISWKDFREIVGNKWDPGLNAPFDPIASKLAQELELEVAVLNGKNLENIENFMDNENYIGTIIKE
jgi:uridylate kinase